MTKATSETIAGPVGDGEQRREYSALVKRYESLIRSAIRRHCPAELALDQDDIAQEVRLRLWKAIEGEKKIANPTSYLYRVAASATIDAIRAARVRRRDAHESLSGNEENPCGETDTVDRAELRRRITAALQRLAPNRRRAVQLHLQGMTTDEVAVVAGWTEPKARNLVYRGLAELRAILGGADAD